MFVFIVLQKVLPCGLPCCFRFLSDELRVPSEGGVWREPHAEGLGGCFFSQSINDHDNAMSSFGNAPVEAKLKDARQAVTEGWILNSSVKLVGALAQPGDTKIAIRKAVQAIVKAMEEPSTGAKRAMLHPTLLFRVAWL